MWGCAPRVLRRLSGGAPQDGVDDVIATMDYYYINREDVDAFIELNGAFAGGKDPLQNVPSQVKAQFTRKYNAGDHKLPYSLVKIAPLRGAGAGAARAARRRRG
jgi:replication factor C subunit 1